MSRVPSGGRVVTGLDPAAVGAEVRLGRTTRENAETKARRLLVEGRVMIRRLDERGALTDVRGDSGVLRRVIFDAFAELWSCDCPARSEKCAHVLAVAAVVVCVVHR